MKIEGLIFGRYGYAKNAWAEKKYNQGKVISIRRKIRNMARYEEWICESKACQENETLKMVTRKLLPLDNDYYCFLHYPEKYEKIMGSIKSWLEEEALVGNRWAQYLKAQSIKYGIFGFSKDREAANIYILKYGLPY